MNIRNLNESDIPRIRELYEKSGAQYPFPDFKEFLAVPAIVDEDDRVIIAVASMPTVEVYLFADHEWETPGLRMEAFKFIHEYVRRDLVSRGVVQVHAFLPPELEKSFGRKLSQVFGWTRSFWPCFSRKVSNG